MIPCIYPNHGLFYATQEEVERLDTLKTMGDAISAQLKAHGEKTRSNPTPKNIEVYDWMEMQDVKLTFAYVDLLQKIQLRNQIERELNG